MYKNDKITAALVFQIKIVKIKKRKMKKLITTIRSNTIYLPLSLYPYT